MYPIDFFACPCCKLPIILKQGKGTVYFMCTSCDRTYKIENGLYHFYDESYWQECQDSVNTFITTCGRLAGSADCSIHTIYPYTQLPEEPSCHIRAALLNMAIELASDHNCFQGRVVDIGAGRGNDSYILSHYSSIIAVDIDYISSAGIQLLNPEINLGITRIVASGEYLPFLDNSIGMVYMMSVFHHMRHKVVALNEWYRVLKPGGILVATGERPADTSEVRDYHVSIALEAGQMHESLWYTASELFEYFDQCLFRNIQHIPIKGKPNMGYLLSKDLVIKNPWIGDQYVCDNGIIYGIKY